MKQAREFSIEKGGQKKAALITFITDINALGLEIAQGLILSTEFYWDKNVETRTFAKRFYARRKLMPNVMNAATYSGVAHFLKAVKAADTKDSLAIAAKMRELLVEDFMTNAAKVREDGLLLRDMDIYEVKAPTESTGPWDYFRHLATIPKEEVYRPLSESTCPMLPKG
jgi:branched-chain amino acid transport system substrate-binding protein